MKQEEYIKTIVYNGHMINIGNDDYGQQYFLEFLNDKGILEEVGCGAYNPDYLGIVEYYLGDPSFCELYGTKEKCNEIFTHGYCHKCPYNEFKILREERRRQNLTKD